MKEIIIKLTDDHIKIKGGEYVRDLVWCDECTNNDPENGNPCHILELFHVDWCSYGTREKEDE